MAWAASGLDERLRRRQRRGDADERLRVDELTSQLGVVGGEGEGDREGPVVPGEDGVLQVAEVTPDRSHLRWVVLAVGEHEEPGEVDDARVLDLFGDGHPDRRQEGRDAHPPTAGQDDDVAVDDRAVLELDPRDEGDRSGTSDLEPARPTQRPLNRRRGGP